MFSVMQETENCQKIWPNIDHVFTTRAPHAEGGHTATVTALGGPCGHMTFGRSRRQHVIYIMNEAGATCARYDLGHDPNAEQPGPLQAAPESPEGAAEQLVAA